MLESFPTLLRIQPQSHQVHTTPQPHNHTDITYPKTVIWMLFLEDHSVQYFYCGFIHQDMP